MNAPKMRKKLTSNARIEKLPIEDSLFPEEPKQVKIDNPTDILPEEEIRKIVSCFEGALQKTLNKMPPDIAKYLDESTRAALFNCILIGKLKEHGFPITEHKNQKLLALPNERENCLFKCKKYRNGSPQNNHTKTSLEYEKEGKSNLPGIIEPRALFLGYEVDELWQFKSIFIEERRDEKVLFHALLWPKYSNTYNQNIEQIPSPSNTKKAKSLKIKPQAKAKE